MLPPCDVMSVCVFCRIFNCTLLTITICVQGLDSVCRLVCLSATSRQSDGTKTQQESIYEAFILGSYGFWQVIIRVTKLLVAYICSVKMVLRRQRSSSNKCWGQKSWEKG